MKTKNRKVKKGTIMSADQLKKLYGCKSNISQQLPEVAAANVPDNFEEKKVTPAGENIIKKMAIGPAERLQS